jgi:regulator of sirC expression with transglutaminase-like and TPR domain
MDVAARFAESVNAPSGRVRLDVGAFCIAACAHPGLDVDEACARLDDLAFGCPERTFAGLRAYLFGEMGFTGNTTDYADPENSYLDAVLARRTGIPITLSALMMETGRRLGIDVRGIGMPGHFLVRDGSAADEWCDPFHGGRVYDLDGCAVLFRRVYGPTAAFSPAFLTPVSARTILARMLANLEQGRAARDPTQLAWMCALHGSIPDLSESERERLRIASRSVQARWN